MDRPRHIPEQVWMAFTACHAEFERVALEGKPSTFSVIEPDSLKSYESPPLWTAPPAGSGASAGSATKLSILELYQLKDDESPTIGRGPVRVYRSQPGQDHNAILIRLAADLNAKPAWKNLAAQPLGNLVELLFLLVETALNEGAKKRDATDRIARLSRDAAEKAQELATRLREIDHIARAARLPVLKRWATYAYSLDVLCGQMADDKANAPNDFIGKRKIIIEFLDGIAGHNAGTDAAPPYRRPAKIPDIGNTHVAALLTAAVGGLLFTREDVKSAKNIVTAER